MTTATLGGVRVAVLWRLLSLGFMPPTEETLTEIDTLGEGLVEAGSTQEIEAVLTATREARLDELATQFASLFRAKVAVSPYEGSYELDPIRQGRQMADVAAFYRAFGAEAHGPAAERPDSAGCELEFLSFLELRRLAAIEERDDGGAQLLDEIATTFLRDHAGRWLPTFFADVHAASADKPAYRALAALGAATIGSELEGRDITCAPLPRRRRRFAVEGDSFDCG